MNSLHFTGLKIEMTEDVYSPTIYEREADPDWQYLDAAGHGHFRDGNKLPTLRAVEEEHYDPDDNETWTSIRHECPQCGEHVIPGTRPARPFSKGRTIIATIDGDDGSEFVVHLTEDEIRGAMDAPRQFLLPIAHERAHERSFHS